MNCEKASSLEGGVDEEGRNTLNNPTRMRPITTQSIKFLPKLPKIIPQYLSFLIAYQ
tara:strand:+ start:175 stop:345 length:171 start_codon:yes stop_codon:yes gene_type:complete